MRAIALIALIAGVAATGCSTHDSYHGPIGGATLAPVISALAPPAAVAPSTTSVPTPPRILYIAQPSAGTVQEVSYLEAADVFTPLASVPSGGKAPCALALDPKGRFLYCANFESNDLSAFAVDAATGALKAIPAGASVTVPGPQQDPVLLDSKTYATPFFSLTTRLFSVPAPTPVTLPATPTAPTGDGPIALAVSPDGAWLAVANLLGSCVTVYAIDPKTGQLTLASILDVKGSAPAALAFDPSGESIYVAGGPKGFVAEVALGANGCTAPAGTPVRVANPATSVSVTADGLRVSTVENDGTVVVLEHDATGQLVLSKAPPSETTESVAARLAKQAKVPARAVVERTASNR